MTVRRLWWTSLAFKLLLGSLLPFAHDEAYYWVWSHHLQLSYFDHPGMIAWLFAMGHWLEPLGNAARLPIVILSHLSLGVWLLTLRNLLSQKQQLIFLILCLLSPLFGISALVATPDVPLVFFWSLAVFLFGECLNRPSSRRSIFIYAALGLSIGLGFTSKYNMVLFIPAAAFALLLSPDRGRFRWRWLPVIVVFAGIGSAPVLLWNLKNDFVSFRFQLEHGLGAHAFKWSWPAEYLGGQILLIFPILLWYSIKNRVQGALWLHAFAWFPLLFFFISSLRSHVEANWPMVAYPTVFALACMASPSLKFIYRTAALWLVLVLIAISHALHPWLPIDQTKLKTYEYIRFDPVKGEFNHELVFAGSYQMASTLSYQLKHPVYKLAGVNRLDFFDFLPESKPQADTFSVVLEPDHGLPQWAVDQGFRIVSTRAITDWYRIVEASKHAPNTDP